MAYKTMNYKQLKIGKTYCSNNYIIKPKKIWLDGRIEGPCISKQYFNYSQNVKAKSDWEFELATPNESQWLEKCEEKNDLTNKSWSVSTTWPVCMFIMRAVFCPGLSLAELKNRDLEFFTALNSDTKETRLFYKLINDKLLCLNPETKSITKSSLDYSRFFNSWTGSGWQFVESTEDEESWVTQCYLWDEFVLEDLSITQNPYDLKLGGYYRVTNSDVVNNSHPNFVTICRVEQLVEAGPKIYYTINQDDPNGDSVEFEEKEQFPHYDWVRCKFEPASKQEIQWLKDSIELGRLAEKPEPINKLKSIMRKLI